MVALYYDTWQSRKKSYKKLLAIIYFLTSNGHKILKWVLGEQFISCRPPVSISLFLQIRNVYAESKFPISTLMYHSGGRTLSGIGYTSLKGDVDMDCDIFPNIKHGFNEKLFHVSTIYVSHMKSKLLCSIEYWSDVSCCSWWHYHWLLPEVSFPSFIFFISVSFSFLIKHIRKLQTWIMNYCRDSFLFKSFIVSIWMF